jgi:glutaredoxin
MTRALLLLFAGLLVAGTAAAERTYKWVDSQGNVSYHDRPPPSDSGYRVEEKQMGGKRAPAGAPDEPARPPVLLYTVSKCAPCDTVRAHLRKRKIPFTEKNVESDVKSQQELKEKSGGLSVPTILVGSKVMNGFVESLLDGELDQAGYPKADPEDKKTEEEGGFRAPTQ